MNTYFTKFMKIMQYGLAISNLTMFYSTYSASNAGLQAKDTILLIVSGTLVALLTTWYSHLRKVQPSLAYQFTTMTTVTIVAWIGISAIFVGNMLANFQISLLYGAALMVIIMTLILKFSKKPLQDLNT